MKKTNLIKTIRILEKYDPILLLTKQIILFGIDGEKGIKEFLKIKIQNYFRDIRNGLYKIENIPNLAL